MKRKALGVTTAPVPAAALAGAGTIGAGAAPEQMTPLLANQEALHGASSQEHAAADRAWAAVNVK